MFRTLYRLSFSPTGAGVLLAGCICFLAQNALGQVLRPLGASTDEHPVKKYKIEGTVINSVTGEAVPRALVQLMGQAQESVLTGGDGRFHFDAVPEGQVAVTGVKPGFFDQMERKRRYWMQYAITVGPDTKPITVTLVPEGVIHGHVEDANGEPIENAQIRVTQFRIQEGRKERQEAAYGKTDEEGNFRIADLRQGAYYVGVEANFSRLQNLIEQSKKNREGYPAVVYYPNSPDLSAAQPVNLTPGQRIELQFSLKREPMFHVSGKVTGVPPGMSANFQWLDLTGGSLAFAMQFERQDSTFKTMVPAGTYLVRVTAPDNNRHALMAQQAITVGSDIPDLRIALARLPSVPVMVWSEAAKEPRSQDAGGPDGPRPEVNVRLVADDSSNRGAWGNFDQQETPRSFKVREILPGKYSVEVTPTTSDKYIQSVRCGTLDLLREKLVVQPGVQLQPIEVVLRDDGATLGGKVNNASADLVASLLIVPQSAPTQPARLIQVFGAAEFRSTALPPGDYKVFAFDSVDQIEYSNPESLGRYASKAATVSLSANGKANVTVDVIRTGE